MLYHWPSWTDWAADPLLSESTVSSVHSPDMNSCITSAHGGGITEASVQGGHMHRQRGGEEPMTSPQPSHNLLRESMTLSEVTLQGHGAKPCCHGDQFRLEQFGFIRLCEAKFQISRCKIQTKSILQSTSCASWFSDVRTSRYDCSMLRLGANVTSSSRLGHNQETRAELFRLG